MEITLDSDVKAPGRGYRYPFPDMKVGQSFFLAADADDRKRIRSAASMHSRKYRRKFKTRHVFENGKTGIRVWRVG